MPTVIIEFPYTADGLRQAQDVADQYGGKVNMDAAESGPLKGDAASKSGAAVSGAGPLSGLGQMLPDMAGAGAGAAPPDAGMGMGMDMGAGGAALPMPDEGAVFGAPPPRLSQRM